MAALLLGLGTSACAQTKDKSPDTEDSPVILVRSGWQTSNIGDIAHTPGLLALLETHAPDAEIVLWGKDLGIGVKETLQRQFPRVSFVDGDVNPDGTFTTDALSQAFDEADLLLHGSAPAIHLNPGFQLWWKESGKPFGYYGVTLDHDTLFAQISERGPIEPETVEFLSDAAFVFFREADSLEAAQKAGIKAEIMEFAPDATFAATQQDEEKAHAWMEAHELEPDAYICIIARTRFAPYYRIRNREPNEIDRRKDAFNARYLEADMRSIREIIVRWVRETGLKVALVPEMVFEMDLHREWVFDRLPEDVKPYVAWREDYWLPDEAAALYENAVALVSMECHSPILASAVGTPAIYLTSSTETYKKQMWNDIGLSDWMFDIDEASSDDIVQTLFEMHRDPTQAQQKLAEAMKIVEERQRKSMAIVHEAAFGTEQ
ncbi:MAG: polysaccharide pyruvyl transferase family protein [Verrucomicrobiota bacterium JB022]|nr:polysaccharide pyruvyl transferase family protein [Verrucomicrobiota bacterium JB022]